MNTAKLYGPLDRQLEKGAFLVLADEGVYGLYEFVQQVNFEFLTIAQKYAIAYELLKELLLDDLIILEEFTDSNLSHKVKTIDATDFESVLNQPFSWYPSGRPTYSVSITQRGIDYLKKQSEPEKTKLQQRLFRSA